MTINYNITALIKASTDAQTNVEHIENVVAADTFKRQVDAYSNYGSTLRSAIEQIVGKNNIVADGKVVALSSTNYSKYAKTAIAQMESDIKSRDLKAADGKKLIAIIDDSFGTDGKFQSRMSRAHGIIDWQGTNESHITTFADLHKLRSTTIDVPNYVKWLRAKFDPNSKIKLVSGKYLPTTSSESNKAKVTAKTQVTSAVKRMASADKPTPIVNFDFGGLFTADMSDDDKVERMSQIAAAALSYLERAERKSKNGQIKLPAIAS